MSRLALIRRAPYYAPPAVLRRRQLRVLAIGAWMLVYTPRDHWSDNL